MDKKSMAKNIFYSSCGRLLQSDQLDLRDSVRAVHRDIMSDYERRSQVRVPLARWYQVQEANAASC